ncbi:MAG: hypothetical protein ACLFPL_04725 [Candidatus Nanoarchaeia archaeon]
MIKSPRTQGELEKAIEMQRVFPNLANGFSKGLTYREIAQKVRKHTEKKHPFTNLAQGTVVKYVAWALRGFEFEGRSYSGLKENEVEEQIRQRRYDVGTQNLNANSQYENWSDDELRFVRELYESGIPPKEIFRKYESNEGFTRRTYDAIESGICAMRKRGEISSYQRINWDSDLGFVALALVGMYGREGNYAKQVREELNNFYFEGEERITYNIFHNFLKRNGLELESILEENEGFER